MRHVNAAFICSIMAVISRFELLFSFKLDSYEHNLWIEPLNYIRIVIILAKNAILFINKVVVSISCFSVDSIILGDRIESTYKYLSIIPTT